MGVLIITWCEVLMEEGEVLGEIEKALCIRLVAYTHLCTSL